MDITTYVGIDIGSTTLKIVLLDDDSNILHLVYQPLYRDPIQSVKSALINNNIHVSSDNVGITGSGRELVGKVLGAKLVLSEITAHAYSCQKLFPDTKTIIEIGGQDSKGIQLNNGTINKFALNKVCAAGTGSFLEWQIARLGESLATFDTLALSYDQIIEFGGKCGIFIESAVVSLQQKGISKSDIAMGICCSLVKNYINDIKRQILFLEPIVFQGGVAKIKAMKKAFEMTLGKSVYVPEYAEYMGAIGMAMLVKDGYTEKMSFLPSNSFSCYDCENNCRIHLHKRDETLVYSGSKCGKYNSHMICQN